MKYYSNIFDLIALYLLTEEMSYILLHENSQVQTMYPAHSYRVNEKKRNIYQVEYAVNLRKEKQ